MAGESPEGSWQLTEIYAKTKGVMSKVVSI
jgi:hypothetical protein